MTKVFVERPLALPRSAKKCTYQKKNSSEFKHEKDAEPNQWKKVQEEAKTVKLESELLKLQIKEHNQIIQNQKKQIDEMDANELKVKQLVSEIKDLKSKIKGDKYQLDTIIAKCKRELQTKDENMMYLQKSISNKVINRPGVAGAVLQSPPLLINWLIDSSFSPNMFNTLLFPNHQS